MPGYDLYFIGPNGRLRRAKPFRAADDVAAIEFANEFRDGSRLELWQGNRKITAFADQVQESGPELS